MTYLSKFVSIIVAPMQIVIGWIVRLIPGFRRLANLSLPTRCGLMAFVFLLILLCVGVLYQMFGGGERNLRTNWSVFLTVLIGLTLFIPFPVYLLVKLLQQRPESPFPEIERAWNWGVTALARQQIDLKNTPLFLILGTDGRHNASLLLQAARIGSSIEPPRGDSHAIQWFGNSSAIFLFVDECSCVSSLVKKRRQGPVAPLLANFDAGAAGATVDASQLDVAQLGRQLAAGAAGATVKQQGGFGGPPREPLFASAEAGSPELTPGAAATMQIDGDSPFTQHLQAARTNSAPRTSNDENTYSARKLAYLCEMIQKARMPICEINGMLTVVPFDLVEGSELEVQAAARKDLQTLRENLRVRCGVNMLVTEMEQQDGFQELVNRVGENYAREMRFGKGCKEWGDPAVQRIRAVANHATGAFEDWTYTLFKNPETLRRKYNTRLVSLLCRTRGKFSKSLESLLSSVFGYDPQRDRESARDQFLFSGCYFAGTGPDEDSQAFIRGVIMKMTEQQGDLEWSDRAIEEEQQLQIVANFVALIAFIALIAFVAGLGYQGYQAYEARSVEQPVEL